MLTMRALKKISFAFILAAALAASQGADAASTYTVGTSSPVQISEFGTCYKVTNSTGSSLFVPTATSPEWQSFYSHSVPSVTLGTCLTPPTITAHTASPNPATQNSYFYWSGSAQKGSSDIAKQRAYVLGSQGGTWTIAPANSSSVSFGSYVYTGYNAASFYHSQGSYTLRYEVQDAAGQSVTSDIPFTVQCDANYGSSCSAWNSCGDSNSGTIQCDGSCDASAPDDPPGVGSACTSDTNACGQSSSGFIMCNGQCSVSTPANTCTFDCNGVPNGPNMPRGCCDYSVDFVCYSSYNTCDSQCHGTACFSYPYWCNSF